ncbi:AMIN domain-containing protein [uncultured Desulfovibrio sp.]|uniref:AMIN domain-containing protein n=1 Tax=Candidatus Desulfovibrio intestinavium TaxID=2838534 RepID=A0A9D2HN53_9BACT|nr:AMIN domain-containing protein [uncultured Desulfovibrio sp.]HJA78799.1 AMIN domain-containing protein [Candidatus Desulfovibrio intestinavium]
MNKAFIGILIAVCVLGMALIMLTEWKASKNEAEPVPSAGSVAPAPQEAPPLSGGSLTPPAAGGNVATAPALSPAPPVPSVPEAPSPAPAVPTPPSEALERGFAFNDTDTPPESPAVAPLPPADAADKPLEAPALDGARLPGGEAPSRPALGSGGQAAPEAPAKADAAPVETAKPEKKADKKPEPAAKARTVTRFVVFARETGATVRIEGSSPIDYKYLTLDNPPRVAVDLVGEWTVKAPGVPRNPAVTNVRLGKLEGRTRVVIDLSGESKVRYILSKDRKRLDVRIDR